MALFPSAKEFFPFPNLWLWLFLHNLPVTAQNKVQVVFCGERVTDLRKYLFVYQRIFSILIFPGFKQLHLSSWPWPISKMLQRSIASDKRGHHVNIFLIFLKLVDRSTSVRSSNEYQKHCFHGEIRKISNLKKKQKTNKQLASAQRCHFLIIKIKL